MDSLAQFKPPFQPSQSWAWSYRLCSSFSEGPHTQSHLEQLREKIAKELENSSVVESACIACVLDSIPSAAKKEGKKNVNPGS